MSENQLEIILQRVKEGLSDLYQDQLESLILYGSQARGEAAKDSDIDLLVVLKSLSSPYVEIDRTGDFIAQLCLDYDAVISRHFISAETFQTKDTPFLQNVRREGVLV